MHQELYCIRRQVGHVWKCLWDCQWDAPFSFFRAIISPHFRSPNLSYHFVARSLVILNHGSGNRYALRPRGPTPFPWLEKGAKEQFLHGTAAAARSRHGRTRSANLPKLGGSRRLRHMERFVFLLCGSKKSPHVHAISGWNLLPWPADRFYLRRRLQIPKGFRSHI